MDSFAWCGENLQEILKISQYSDIYFYLEVSHDITHYATQLVSDYDNVGRQSNFFNLLCLGSLKEKKPNQNSSKFW